MKEEFGPDDQVTARVAGLLVNQDRRTIIAWIQRGWLPATKRPGERGRYMIRYGDLMAVANRPYHPEKEHKDA